MQALSGMIGCKASLGGFLSLLSNPRDHSSTSQKYAMDNDI